jgi:hypothetical protein
MECAVREDDGDDGTALPKGRGARPSGFGVLDREVIRNVAVDRTLPGAAASLCRPTAPPATDKVCRIVDFDLASLEIRTTAGLGGGGLRFPLSVSDHVLRTGQVVLAGSAFRTGVPFLTLCAGDPAVLEKSTASAGAHRFVTPCIPHRPLKNLPDQAAPRTVERGTPFGDWPRDWDSAIRPNANPGFIKADQDILRGPEEARTA